MVVGEQKYTPGSLVRARGRDWVVMSPEETDVVRLRPVDGSDEDAIGIYLPLEPNALEQATYLPPDPDASGDFAGGMLLRDAVRLNLRSGAGPFRSMGRVSVVPRPYQFVPLLMALKLDTVRLLIADDVGIGKTIEALMIARELLDRGEIRSIGVLCPPHLCEQWAREMREKFHIDAAVVQPSRLRRLEREVPRADMSIYQHYRHFVASIDFIKLPRHKQQFLDNLPDLIIVDEAHGASRPPSGGRGRAQQLRYDLLKEISSHKEKHLVLVTATPHSGIEESFRSLLGTLNPVFDREGNLPRKDLVPHLVQRRRIDVVDWMGSGTKFPVREARDVPYQLSDEYLRLFQNVLDYCRESVQVGGTRGGRVRYWAAISILRCLMSSPGAAGAMLQARKQRVIERSSENNSPPADDELHDEYRLQILDNADTDAAPDYIPTGAIDDPLAEFTETEMRRLDGYLRQAKSLAGTEADTKLKALVNVVDEMLREGYRPIVYCRFIATARYLEDNIQLQLKRMHPGLRVKSVTGDDGGSEQREEIVKELSRDPIRVLVATDCLSEGINLQMWFDAVVHYDLPWNPNRLEQREGRVDRFGQTKSIVKTALLYGSNNQIDILVRDILIDKARTIRNSLGISVPVPDASQRVIEALIDGVLLTGRSRRQQMALPMQMPEVSEFHQEWDAAAERESENRAYFAQRGIDPGDVARELDEMNPILGEAEDVQRFIANAIQRFNGELRSTRDPDVFEFHPGDLRERIKLSWPDAPEFPVKVSFIDPAPEGTHVLVRNHPVVSTLAGECLAKSLQGQDERFARSTAIYTDSVTIRTAVAVLRLRYQLQGSTDQFAEEVVTVAFTESAGGSLEWIDSVGEVALRLLSDSRPRGNMTPEERSRQTAWAIGVLSDNPDSIERVVQHRVSALEESHQRLRSVTDQNPLKVVPHKPPDILGVYTLLPAGGV